MYGSLVSAATKAGADLTAALKKSVPGSLLIDAGDATQGSSFATLTKGKDLIRLKNAVGYDVMAAGNHEFDYGQYQLLLNAQAEEFPVPLRAQSCRWIFVKHLQSNFSPC